MFYLNVWLKLNDPAQAPRVRELMKQCVSLSRTEPGCKRYEVYHSQSEPGRLLLCEHWETKADWERHRTAKAFVEVYQPQVLPLVTREPHICDLVEAE